MLGPTVADAVDTRKGLTSQPTLSDRGSAGTALNQAALESRADLRAAGVPENVRPLRPFRWLNWALSILVALCLMLGAWVWLQIFRGLP